MIDPLVSLAFSVQSNKGVYALLVGSGISRSSGIPTGWEITLDLTTKIAAAHGEDARDDPEAWYRSKFGKEPNYSELLDALCKTQAERQQLLRPYFEPNEDEKKQGLKQPTRAHRAIAQLMVGGYIRVAVTMNFDRLLEQAIQDAGTSPFVISSDDGVSGALPLAHQKCCVVKLHGDYLDTRIKNTPDELSTYSTTTNGLLDRIVDEFGLIVCGWSAQWDIALRAAIERCASHRFTTYWCSRGAPADEADRLVKNRYGQLISITDADTFFTKLADTVRGIEDANVQHPASLAALSAITKRYLAEPTAFIALSDLVHEEVEVARKAVEVHNKDVVSGKLGNDFNKIFARYRQLVERVQTLLVHGCAFGSRETYQCWISCIQRIANRDSIQGQQVREGLAHYSAMYLLYAGGLVAVGNNRLDLLAELLLRPTVKDWNGQKMFLQSSVWSDIHELCELTLEGDRKFTPRSEHLFVVLREPLRRYLPDDSTYEEVYDQFELILALTFMDHHKRGPFSEVIWSPPGRLYWKAKNFYDQSLISATKTALEKEKENWPPLKFKLCGGSIERATELHGELVNFIGKLQWY